MRSDWATAVEDASILCVQGGFFNNTHRDADDLSFEWFERGRKILSDSGKYIVVSDDPFRDYFNSTRAHNTIEVDGEDYSRRDEEAYGSAVERIERAADEVLIALQVHHDDLAFGHRREIHYRPGERLTLIDAVQSERGGPRRYVQWHHFERAFDLAGGQGRFRASDGEVSVALEVSSSCGDRTTYELVRGQTEPRIAHPGLGEHRQPRAPSALDPGRRVRGRDGRVHGPVHARRGRRRRGMRCVRASPRTAYRIRTANSC